MKAAYFHCFAGISGDMTLGALVDLGLPLDILETELKKLSLSHWELSGEKIKKKGIEGTKVRVQVREEKKHRHLTDIWQIIDQSALSPAVKDLSKEIFSRLAWAEAKVHGSSAERIHFHEVGALDAIIDIVGTAVGVSYLGIEKVYASELHVGRGTVNCAHGLLPVPAPATMELLQGVPIYSTEVEGELVTPTGAAILTTLCENFGPLPRFRVGKTGYGAGEKDFPMANFLRVSLGWQEEPYCLTGQAVVLETNLDDLNPQIYQYVMQRLLDAGALDVFLQPILMKKGRPGTLLQVLSSPEKADYLAKIIFGETTTLGLRIYPVERKMLEREFWQVQTPYGLVQVKAGKLEGKIVNLAPEYEDCKKIAQEQGVPLKVVLDSAKKQAYERMGGENE